MLQNTQYCSMISMIAVNTNFSSTFPQTEIPISPEWPIENLSVYATRRSQCSLRKKRQPRILGIASNVRIRFRTHCLSPAWSNVISRTSPMIRFTSRIVEHSNHFSIEETRRYIQLVMTNVAFISHLDSGIISVVNS